MPIYEFECKKCGNSFELLTEFGKESVPCPDCNGLAFKILSALGGYKIKGDNSSSTKPKGGAFK